MTENPKQHPPPDDPKTKLDFLIKLSPANRLAFLKGAQNRQQTEERYSQERENPLVKIIESRTAPPPKTKTLDFCLKLSRENRLAYLQGKRSASAAAFIHLLDEQGRTLPAGKLLEDVLSDLNGTLRDLGYKPDDLSLPLLELASKYLDMQTIGYKTEKGATAVKKTVDAAGAKASKVSEPLRTATDKALRHTAAKVESKIKSAKKTVVQKAPIVAGVAVAAAGEAKAKAEGAIRSAHDASGAALKSAIDKAKGTVNTGLDDLVNAAVKIQPISLGEIPTQPLPRSEIPGLEIISDQQSQALMRRVIISKNDQFPVTPGLLAREGFNPKYKVEHNGATYYFPDNWYKRPAPGNATRDAIAGYVEKDGRLCAKTFYRSASQSSWRLMPAYISGVGIDKGYGEESLNLPIQIQKHLDQIILKNPPRLLIDPEFFFRGLTPSVNEGNEQEFHGHVDEAPLKLEGQFYRSDDYLAAAENMVFANPNQSPNFGKKTNSWIRDTELYGQITVDVYPSQDGKLQYLFCRNTDNIAWVGQIEIANSESTQSGLHQQWVHAGDLTTPAYEYKRQAHIPNTSTDISYRQERTRGSYLNIFDDYQSKIPVIQEYLESLKPEESSQATPSRANRLKTTAGNALDKVRGTIATGIDRVSEATVKIEPISLDTSPPPTTQPPSMSDQGISQTMRQEEIDRRRRALMEPSWPAQLPTTPPIRVDTSLSPQGQAVQRQIEQRLGMLSGDRTEILKEGSEDRKVVEDLLKTLSTDEQENLLAAYGITPDTLRIIQDLHSEIPPVKQEEGPPPFLERRPKIPEASPTTETPADHTSEEPPKEPTGGVPVSPPPPTQPPTGEGAAKDIPSESQEERVEPPQDEAPIAPEADRPNSDLPEWLFLQKAGDAPLADSTLNTTASPASVPSVQSAAGLPGAAPATGAMTTAADGEALEATVATQLSQTESSLAAGTATRASTSEAGTPPPKTDSDKLRERVSDTLEAIIYHRDSAHPNPDMARELIENAASGILRMPETERAGFLAYVKETLRNGDYEDLEAKVNGDLTHEESSQLADIRMIDLETGNLLNNAAEATNSINSKITNEEIKLRAYGIIEAKVDLYLDRHPGEYNKGDIHAALESIFANISSSGRVAWFAYEDIEKAMIVHPDDPRAVLAILRTLPKKANDTDDFDTRLRWNNIENDWEEYKARVDREIARLEAAISPTHEGTKQTGATIPLERQGAPRATVPLVETVTPGHEATERLEASAVIGEKPASSEERELTREESVDKFCSDYLALHHAENITLTPEQKHQLVEELEKRGFVLEKGRLLVSEEYMGDSFHARILNMPTLALPDGVPQPVVVKQLAKRTVLRYNFPFGLSSDNIPIVTRPTLYGKRVQYEFTHIINPHTTDLRANTTIDRLAITENPSLYLDEDVSLQLNGIEIDSRHPGEFSLELAKGSKLIIPESMLPSLLPTTRIREAQNATLVIVNNRGEHWAFDPITAYGVALEDALAGLHERVIDVNELKLLTADEYDKHGLIERGYEKQRKDEISTLISPDCKEFVKEGKTFQTLKRLGGGKYGDAYLAISADGTQAVFKVQNKGLDDNERRRFGNEPSVLNDLAVAQKSLGLTTNNRGFTPSLLGDGETIKGRPYFAMTLAQGIPLDELNREGYALSMSDTMTIVDQFSRVLEAMHSTDRAYLDFQPKNIFWDPRTREITCVDFNLLSVIKPGDNGPVQTDIQCATSALYRLLTLRGFGEKQSLTEQVNNIPNIGNLRQIVTRAFEDGYSSIREFRTDLANFSTNYNAAVDTFDPISYIRDLPPVVPMLLQRSLIATQETLALEGEITNIQDRIDEDQVGLDNLKTQKEQGSTQLSKLEAKIQEETRPLRVAWGNKQAMIEQAEKEVQDSRQEAIAKKTQVAQLRAELKPLLDDISEKERALAEIKDRREASRLRGEINDLKSEKGISTIISLEGDAEVKEKIAEGTSERLARYQAEADELQRQIDEKEAEIQRFKDSLPDFDTEEESLIEKIGRAEGEIVRLQADSDLELQAAQKEASLNS